MDDLDKNYGSPELAAADAASSAASDAELDAQIALLKTKPATAAGALALLGVIAEFLDEDDGPDFFETPDAIRAALAVLRREA